MEPECLLHRLEGFMIQPNWLICRADVSARIRCWYQWDSSVIPLIAFVSAIQQKINAITTAAATATVMSESAIALAWFAINIGDCQKLKDPFSAPREETSPL